MENEERNILNELLARVKQLEDRLPGTSSSQLSKRKRLPLTKKLVLQIFFRALLLALLAIGIGMIAKTIFKKSNRIENQQKLPVNSETTLKNGHNLDSATKKSELQKKIDSLNNLLIEEVSGSGKTKQPGFGPSAKYLKKVIDSLKLQE